MPNYPFQDMICNCCATRSLSGFYGPADQIDRALAKLFPPESSIAAEHDYIVVLDNKQNVMYRDVMHKHGFELVREWNNRVHGPSTLYLYMRGFK